jgi:hypothetical protein
MQRSARVFSLVLSVLGLAGAYACGEDSSPSGTIPTSDASIVLDGATGFDATTGADSSTTSDTGAPDTGTPDGAIPNYDSLINLKIGFLGSTSSSGALKDFFFAQTGKLTDTIDPASLGASELAPFDLLIVANLSRLYSATEADALAAWVAGGKGVFFLPGFTGVNTQHNSLLTRFNLQLNGFIGGSGSDHGLLTFTSHPVAKDVRGLLFYGGASVDDVDGGDAGTYSTYVTLGADVVGRVGFYGRGRIVVFGDEWISYDQEVNYTIDAGPLPEDGGANASTPTKQYWHNVVAFIAGRL